jgi:hypothetical protein
MHRRPLGRGRRLAALFALVTLLGCFLPWETLGGDDNLPAYVANGFQSSGILVFLAAMATLALVSLPFASERPVGLDRWTAYLIVLAVGSLGFAVRLVALAGDGLGAIRPDHAPGLIVVAIGLIGLARAVFEIHEEPEPR